MSKRMGNRKRALTKRVTSINFYVDQATQIQAIMEATGTRMEAPLVRQLVDEALAARRRKLVPVEAPEQLPSVQDVSEVLETIQALLLRLVGQGQTAFCIDSMTLELLQETLADARATRLGLWETLVVPALKAEGKSTTAIAELFDAKTVEAQDFAYGLAEDIKMQLLATETKTTASEIDDNDDRQGRLLYDATSASEK